MAVNIIVAAITLLMAVFVVIWFGWPCSRAWIEAPKYQPLEWDDGH